MGLAGRALVHGDKAGVRSRCRGQLRGQAGHPRVKEPVNASGRYLARMREGRGQLVTVRRQVESMKSRGADEPPVEEGRRAGTRQAPGWHYGLARWALAHRTLVRWALPRWAHGRALPVARRWPAGG